MAELTEKRVLASPKPTRRRQNFIERTVHSLADILEQSLYAEEMAKTNGFLQGLDPRIKVVGLLLLVVAAAMARSLLVIGVLFGVAILLAYRSQVPIRRLATRVWLGVLFFTGVIALPAIFVTPGTPLVQLPFLHWSITLQGVRAALYLLTRVETATTFSALLMLCTPWNHVLKALRVLHVPVVFVVILGITYRYIFVLLQTAADMFESRQSRLVGRLTSADQRRLAAASVGVLLSKSMQLSSEVYLAMLARGYRGELYTLDDFQAQPKDWFALAGFIVVAALALWLGRS